MKLKWFLLLVMVTSMAVPSMSYADDSVLTEERIKAFHKEATDVQLEGLKPTIGFLKKHTHEEAETVLHVMSNMAGAPSQKQTLTLDKEGLLRETQKGFEVGKIKSIENSVLSTTINDDGRSAKVKDSTYSVVIMSMNTHQGLLTFRAEQSMLCDSHIILSDDNVIQVKGNVCNAETTIKPVQ